MSSGYTPVKVNVITEDFVREVCPNELDNFLQALGQAEVELQHFAIQQDTGLDWGDWGDEVDQTYDELVTEFKARTGLHLEVGYHDSENDGSCYDEVSGVFWSVRGVYQYTPAGEKYKDKIQEASFVTFG